VAENKKHTPNKTGNSTFEKVHFTPGKEALEEANSDGFKEIGKGIISGLKTIIMQERTVIVEAALAMIKKHEQNISKIRPAVEAMFNAKKVLIQEACFTGTQNKLLEEYEGKRNRIAIALNLVMKEPSRETFEALKVSTDKNKAAA
jgi:hypothetical protein